VAIGSELDGAPVPDGLDTAAGLNTLRNAMEEAGFGVELVTKVCSTNWLDFLTNAMPES